MSYRTFLSTHAYDMGGLQMIGHLINGKGKKVAGPTISGSFDGVLTAHMEDGSERKLWEKNWGPHGRDGRCVTCVSPWTDTRCVCCSSAGIKAFGYVSERAPGVSMLQKGRCVGLISAAVHRH